MSDTTSPWNEEEIQSLVAEAEAGLDLSQARREPNPHYTGPRLSEETWEHLNNRALAEGRHPDEILEEIVSDFFHAAQT
ncbi:MULTISPECIES: hypothetical protein [unclassified Corynebacterium]|uniref:hypothetical protein n=1 Tax=unclassified Corynebacterium TaxID=2624378 RepID=UPI0029CA0EAF|nr:MULTISPECIES: hypothetical protein [unclassified Corynebacterium]WPF65580.1 hypothetical protein OLX12_08350 [Corynebacterium sp. 22KM0430]WPF68075.1 hypothetical protein OLW90_08340 [Corynebacterium sp. 21KM1197]